MQQPRTARDIITALGGTRVVAGFSGVERNVASQWYRIGIPAKYWLEIARQAAQKTDTAGWVTLDVLERHIGTPAESDPQPASAAA